MQVSVTFRHVNPTPALRTYAEGKVTRVVKKYLRRPGDAHVILAVSKARHIAEITLQADHVSLFAKEETVDLYSAIDLATEKLERQAQKLKARRKEHKGQTAARVAAEPVTKKAARKGQPARRKSGGVIRTRRVSAKPMPVDEAVARLSESQEEFLVFNNAATQLLSVLYRRKDGNFGLIEPEGS
jgi:ribosome hibernation promoting factor